jgi:hypothetical protein
MRSPDLVVSLIRAKNIPSRYIVNHDAKHKASAFLPFINPNSKAGVLERVGRMMCIGHQKAANLMTK